MAVITVKASNPGNFALQTLMHGLDTISIGGGTFEVTGARETIERLAAKNGGTIISDYDITVID